MNRQELFNKIQSLGFVLYDTALFLDTHPQNALALDFYRENQEWYLKYRKEYETMYGPLTLNGVNTTGGWSWTQGPWPWEVEA